MIKVNSFSHLGWSWKWQPDFSDSFLHVWFLQCKAVRHIVFSHWEVPRYYSYERPCTDLIHARTAAVSQLHPPRGSCCHISHVIKLGESHFSMSCHGYLLDPVGPRGKGNSPKSACTHTRSVKYWMTPFFIRILRRAVVNNRLFINWTVTLMNRSKFD